MKLKIIPLIKEPLTPWLYPAFFLLVAVLALAGLPEHTAAWIVCVFFFVIALLHPLNGIYFIMLAVPFFLGASKRPFYLPFEFFVYTAILSGGIHYFIRKPGIKLNRFMLPVLVFGAVSLLSIPLEFKEIIWDLRVWHASESIRAFLSAHEGTNMYYFRMLFNYISGILLFFSAFIFIKGEKDISRIFKPVILILFVNAAFTYLFRYDIIPRGGTYLSLSLVGRHGPGASGFAYNRGYLNQYLSVFFPFALFFIIKKNRGKIMPAASGLILAAVFAAMALTFQRASAVVIAGQFLLLAVFSGIISEKPAKSLAVISAVFIILAGIFFASDHILLSGRGIHRLVSEGIGPRIYLWRVCRAMLLENPLFGIGHGRYLIAFRDYCDMAGVRFERVQFARTTAHNVYLHILSEQGVLGLASFLFIVITAFFFGFKKIKTLPRDKQFLLMTVFLSLAGWLLYGLTQHAFYLRSIGISFWILLAFAAYILKDSIPRFRPGKKFTIAVLAIFIILLAYRTVRVIKHPYPENYYAGFHRAEMQPEGRTARWIGKKAIRSFPVEEGNLIIGLKCPTPAVTNRPQEVEVTLNGYSKVAILADTEYKELLFPARVIPDERVWLSIKPSYTVSPRRESWSDDSRLLGAMVYEPEWEEH